ncbi:hypothetical protein FFLO_01706 [Filobasidium floriforme]|uniref:Mitochondrial glycine transporter n=1 Tax=Filobasidium floriforme TaxID=5210 RepID=A0A8K0NUN8_9TREE|nr:mitochondrial carrier domain-containing protein [Filobasidium floriforme]KAG7562877.1 hypothetical protein FFLO_01706 [Filobasidium floriforme]KAH8086433.1 mitochondrial carrier domain-containing protein [Filobasidium floriforme]
MAKRENKAYQHLASGGLSGLASAIALQPLDLIKTRLQQGVDVKAGGHASGIKGKGREIIPTVRLVVQEEGWRGLWKGTVPTLARNVPGVAVYFYLLSEIRYGLSQTGFFSQSPTTLIPSALPPGSTISSSISEASRHIPSPSPSSSPEIANAASSAATTANARSSSSTLPKLSSQGNIVAGAVARTSVGFVLNPITVLKSRYESGLYPTGSIVQAFRDLLVTDGLRGMFRGFTATAARDAPYAGMYMAFYEKGKDVLGRSSWKSGLGLPSAMIHTVSGMSAAMLATLATSPADTIKTRMQVLPKANPTIRAAVTSIFQERGLSGFFAGSSLRISRKAASSAIGWTVYEGLLLALRDKQIV